MINIRWFNRKNKKGYLGFSYTETHVSLVSLTHQHGSKPRVDMAHIAQVALGDAVALRTVVSQLAVKSLPCNAVMNVDQYQIMQVDRPNMPEAEIKLALRWKVKEMLDYQVEHATVDGLNVPTDPANPNRLPLMFAVCARNAVLADVTNQLVDVGLNLKSLDVHALAQRNIAALLEVEGRALAMVSLLNKGCLLTFTANGELYHTRFIELDKGFSLDLSGSLFSSNLERLVLELQRSLDSFDRQFPFLTVNKLLIAPDASSTRLMEALKSSLYLQVDTFELADIVDFAIDMDFSSLEKQALLLPALGAALRVEVSV